MGSSRASQWLSCRRFFFVPMSEVKKVKGGQEKRPKSGPKTRCVMGSPEEEKTGGKKCRVKPDRHRRSIRGSVAPRRSDVWTLSLSKRGYFYSFRAIDWRRPLGYGKREKGVSVSRLDFT